MVVHQSEAVTEAQKNQVPTALRKGIQSNAFDVESIERFDYDSTGTFGVEVTARAVYTDTLIAEYKHEFDNLRVGAVRSRGNKVKVTFRFD